MKNLPRISHLAPRTPHPAPRTPHPDVEGIAAPSVH